MQVIQKNTEPSPAPLALPNHPKPPIPHYSSTKGKHPKGAAEPELD